LPAGAGKGGLFTIYTSQGTLTPAKSESIIGQSTSDLVRPSFGSPLKHPWRIQKPTRAATLVGF